MNKKISENASSASTTSGSIAVISTPLNHNKPLTRSRESLNSNKYSNTPNIEFFGRKGDSSVNR